MKTVQLTLYFSGHRPGENIAVLTIHKGKQRQSKKKGFKIKLLFN